jgi:hypothetical protein
MLLLGCTIVVFFFGIYPRPLVEAGRNAAMALFG